MLLGCGISGFWGASFPVKAKFKKLGVRGVPLSFSFGWPQTPAQALPLILLPSLDLKRKLAHKKPKYFCYLVKRRYLRHRPGVLDCEISFEGKEKDTFGM